MQATEEEEEKQQQQQQQRNVKYQLSLFRRIVLNMHYYCQCLNVTIKIIEIDRSASEDILSIDLIPFSNLSETWFQCRLLSEQSIDVRWLSLIHSTTIRDMQLNRCLICNQYTHILYQDSNRILLNRELLNETNVKDRLVDPNYSKILKVILPNRLNQIPLTSSMAFQDDIIQRECELAQQMYRQSIDKVEQETEEKIRIYQRDQEALLKKNIDAMNKELENVLHLMHSVSQQTSTIKPAPILSTSIPFINENSTESGFGSDIFDGNGTDSNRPPSIIERTLSDNADNLDEDPMLDNNDWMNGKDNSPNFARSVPKDITFRFKAIPELNPVERDDLERIGKSFRELSQSLMCTDGTELFGDLPSPRFNGK